MYGFLTTFKISIFFTHLGDIKFFTLKISVNILNVQETVSNNSCAPDFVSFLRDFDTNSKVLVQYPIHITVT